MLGGSGESQGLRFLDLFSGIGGFALGLERAGHECIGHSEIEKNADAIYSEHFPRSENFGDIRRIDPETLPKFDMLTGGFPCQPFSLLGMRKGTQDHRGDLFDEIMRIAKSRRPRVLLLENVPGIFAVQEGEAFGHILYTMDACGYDVEWQVLDSQNHGCPQHRERVYIIGHLRGKSRPGIFHLSGKDEMVFSQSSIKQASQVFRGMPEKYQFIYPDGIGNTVVKTSTNRTKIYLGERQQPALGQEQQVDISKFRYVTLLETERVMGFPDNWTKYGDGRLISKTARYAALGNAVTPPVIEYLGRRLND